MNIISIPTISESGPIRPAVILPSCWGFPPKSLNLEGDEGNLQYSSAVQAVVDWSGFVDPVTAYNYSPKNPKNGVVELVGSGDPNAVTEDKVIASSPLTYVHRRGATFLIEARGQ